MPLNGNLLIHMWKLCNTDSKEACFTEFVLIFVASIYLFICCFTSRSTARVILRWVVLQVGEISAYCTVNHRASASNYQLSNMKCPAQDSNRQPQRLEARTLTTEPPFCCIKVHCKNYKILSIHSLVALTLDEFHSSLTPIKIRL